MRFRTYLQSPEGVRGFFPLSFLVMRVYFVKLMKPRERKMTGKVSVEEVLFGPLKIERVVQKDRWEYYASISKKARNIESIFFDMLPVG